MQATLATSCALYLYSTTDESAFSRRPQSLQSRGALSHKDVMFYQPNFEYTRV